MFTFIVFAVVLIFFGCIWLCNKIQSDMEAPITQTKKTPKGNESEKIDKVQRKETRK